MNKRKQLSELYEKVKAGNTPYDDSHQTVENLLLRREQATYMHTKEDLEYTVCEAKLISTAKLCEQMTDEAFAYEMAANPNARAVTLQLTQRILQPAPVDAIKNNPQKYIDLGAGISTFYAEIKQPTEIEIETAVQMENIICSIEAGEDTTFDPDQRKSFYRMAGLSEECVKALVPLSEYYAYEHQGDEEIRRGVLEDFGLSDKEELTDEEELLVQTQVEERRNYAPAPKVPEPEGPTYESAYRISAAELYNLFAPENAQIKPEEGQNIPVNDEHFAYLMQQANVEAQYNELLDCSMEDSLNQLASMDGTVISASDIAFAEELEQEMPNTEESEQETPNSTTIDDSEIEGLNDGGPQQ